MSFYKKDVQKLKAEIEELCPNLKVENWLDHGWAIEVIDPQTGKFMIACQPAWPERGRSEILLTAQQVKLAFDQAA